MILKKNESAAKAADKLKERLNSSEKSNELVSDEIDNKIDLLKAELKLKEVQKKTDPDIYLMACEQLGVKPSEAIGVEDSINGVKSSAAAGMCAVMVIDLIQPTDEIREIASKICDNVREIQAYFE